MVRNNFSSFDHMFQLPSLHLQPDIQWHSGATNLDMRSLEEGFRCALDGQDQNLSTIDF